MSKFNKTVFSVCFGLILGGYMGMTFQKNLEFNVLGLLMQEQRILNTLEQNHQDHLDRLDELDSKVHSMLGE